MLWTPISERLDVAQIIFPRKSSAVLNPESILDRISWPTMTDEDDDCSVEDKSCVTGYLRQFIQNASTDKLKALIKFLVGWEAPKRTLTVEISNGSLPRSSTCNTLTTITLPRL
ncbi:hypothetical protein AMECASPLE_016356 [Ameca splendens]|uniref:Uncharacterized protein n=1 Tax=Ameca splendens TaxID=208324 RepID=A0ABV0XF70_9TELE